MNPSASKTVPSGSSAMAGATRVTTCSIESAVSKALVNALLPRTLLTKLDWRASTARMDAADDRISLLPTRGAAPR